MKSIKLISVFLIVSLLFASLFIALPEPVQASEKEYKELNPVHVHNGTATNLACWGDDLAWSSGWGNLTLATSSGPGVTIDTDYYSSYADLAMSDSHMVWTNLDHDGVPYTSTDIFYAPVGSGSTNSMPSNTENDDLLCRIDGNKVVYEGYDDVGSELRVATIGASSYSVIPVWPDSWNYDISGDTIVTMGDYSALQFYDTSGALIKDYGQGYYSTENLRISGDYITYYNVMDFGNGANIFVKNWKTNETLTVIYHMEGQPGGLDIEGNFVTFWAQTNPELVGSTTASVFIYDIQAEKVFRVSPAYDAIYALAIGGGKIAWSEGPSTNYQDYTLNYRNIWTAQLPAPGAAPVDDDPIIPDDGDDHIIGVLGGILTRDGFNLNIPSGSLSGDTTFSVNERSVSNENVLAAFDILPAGVTFNPAAELTLDIPGTRAAGNELMHLEDGQWVSTESTTSADGGSLIAQITQTGSYAVTVARDTISQAIDTAGGIVTIPDVSLDIPANALAGLTDVSIEETFVDASNVVNAFAVNLGGAVLSVPAQLNFDIPSGVDSATAQVGQLVGNSWIEVESTVNSAGQLVADITEGGIYALIDGATGSGGIIDIPFPSGGMILAVMLSTGLAMAVVRRKKVQ